MGMWVSFFSPMTSGDSLQPVAGFSVDGPLLHGGAYACRSQSESSAGREPSPALSCKDMVLDVSFSDCLLCVYIYILCIYAYIVVYILYIIDNNIIYAYHIYIYIYIYMHIIYIIILKSVEFMPPAFSNWAPEPAFRPSANPIGRTGHLHSTKTSKNNGFHKWVWINIILIGINKYWSIPTYWLLLYLLPVGKWGKPLLINQLFLGGWTSILTQLFWCEQKGYYWFWHTAKSQATIDAWLFINLCKWS